MLKLKIHNILDYVLGVLLIFAPAILGLRNVPAVRHLFVIAGLCLIVYSLVTDTFLSAFRLIDLRVHRGLDMALGIVLLLGPTIFGYSTRLNAGQLLANVILGLIPMGMAGLTSEPELDLAQDQEEEPPRKAA
jgi:hypothetical protein